MKEQILLIEDDEALSRMMRLQLEHAGYQVTACQTGASGLQAARESEPDVILLDLKLPKIDGHEVLKRVKEDESLRSIPVVVLTTSDAEADRTKAYMSHANSYVVKPVDFDSFDRIVRDLEFYWAAVNAPAP